MKRDEKEIKVTVNGNIDLRNIPKEIYNVLIASLYEEILKSLKDGVDNYSDI